jgi:hypothetical protein
MAAMTEHEHGSRRPSPWPGSQYETRHRWQLDATRTLADAAQDLRAIAAELIAAHAAGWSLLEPMRGGHLLAGRLSRRQRAQAGPAARSTGETGAAPAVRWRVRLVEEQPVLGDEVLCLDSAERTVVLTATDSSLRQVRGPAVSADLLDELTRQLSSGELGRRRWGVAPARVGPSVDLVADGSALRIHALHDGALIRTTETLTFQHAANGAATMLSAAAAYQRLRAAGCVFAEEKVDQKG